MSDAGLPCGFVYHISPADFERLCGQSRDAYPHAIEHEGYHPYRPHERRRGASDRRCPEADLRGVGLDAAWKRAEAALPEGWAITAIENRQAQTERPLGDEAWRIGAMIPKNPYTGWRYGRGPTPAAALLALAERLRQR